MKNIPGIGPCSLGKNAYANIARGAWKSFHKQFTC